MPQKMWFYQDGVVEHGPASRDEFVRMARAGRIAPSTRVRPIDESDWRTAGEAFPHIFRPSGETVDPAKTWQDRSPHPWSRYVARTLDTIVSGSIGGFVLGFIPAALGQPQLLAYIFPEGGAGQLIDVLMTAVFAMPVSAVMIGLTGGSVGKWILGVRVLKDDAPIGVWPALRREFKVWLFGLALAIPFVSLVSMWTAKTRLESRGKTIWDDDLQLDIVHRPDSQPITILKFAVAVGAILGLQIAYRMAA